MAGHGERGSRGAEPRGFVPRAWTAGPASWRRVVDWLLGDREAIDQQGLLAERTLLPSPSSERAEAGGAPDAGADRGRRRLR